MPADQSLQDAVWDAICQNDVHSGTLTLRTLAHHLEGQNQFIARTIEKALKDLPHSTATAASGAFGAHQEGICNFAPYLYQGWY